MKRATDPTWQQSLYGFAFWIALAAVLALLFFRAYLPFRTERREQLGRKALLERQVLELQREVRLRELQNQAVQASDEVALRNLLQREGYAGEGRGVVRVSDPAEDALPQPGR